MNPRVADRVVDYTLIAATLVLIALPALGATSLWDRDEGYYCAVSQEMLAAGDWIRPTFNGQLFSEKPPLLYWTQMASFSLLGNNEFAARLPTVLAALATLVLVYELARGMFDRATALGSTLILATCVEFCLQAHAATPDMPLVLFTVGSLLCFWKGLTGDGALAWHAAAGVLTGLAMLTKGPVGIVLPGLTVALYAVWNAQPGLLARRSIWLGIGVSLLVAAPWYIAVALQTDYAFFREFFGTHNVGRFVSPLQNHRGSMFYQAIGILVFYSPWNLVLLAVLVASLQAAFRRAAAIGSTESTAVEDTLAGRNAYRFLMSWTITYLVFFSLAATQLPHYVFPLYPPLAILTARYLERWRQRLVAPALAVEWVALGAYVLVGAVAAVGLLVAGGAVRLPWGKVDVIPGLAVWSLAALVLPAAAGVALALRARGRRTATLGVLWLGALAFVALLAAGPPQHVERLKAPRGLASAVQQHSAGRTVRLASVAYFQPSLVYYFGPVLQRLPGPAAARELLEQPAPLCVLLPEQKWQALAPEVKAECRVVGRQYDLYTREEVVAVCNFPPTANEAWADRSPAAGQRR